MGGPYTDLMLPHIFGECARPRYNNVTATFIEAVIQGKLPKVNPDGIVLLLHAGAAALAAIAPVIADVVNKVGEDKVRLVLPVLREMRLKLSEVE